MKKIVFPDASPNMRKLVTENVIQRIEKFAKFEMYAGRPESEDELFNRVKDADGVLLGWDMPKSVMKKCEKLKIISFAGYGVHNFVDVHFANKRDIVVTNTPNYGNNAVAEHSLALLLALTKNIVNNDEKVRKGNWAQPLTSIEMSHKTIGLVGIGGIGKQMLEYCKALGMNVLCWTFNPSEERGRSLGVQFVSLKDLFQKSDFISLHLPYTNKTKGIINQSLLENIKPGAFIINTARAELVDTEALVSGLKSGRIGGAGLDVFDEEPISVDNPLLELDNVILSPHVGYNTIQSTENILNISVDNLVNFFNNDPTNIVTE